jgi:uncharacterized membrane protein
MVASAITTAQPQSIHSTEHATPAERPVNVGDFERWLSLLGGGLLALYSVRRALGHSVLLVGAGALLYRGLTGHCPLYQTMAVSTTSQETTPDSRRGLTDTDDSPRIVLAES